MLLALVLLAAPTYPAYTDYVVDQARMLDPASKEHLLSVASRLDHAGIAQLAVLTIDESALDGDAREEYAATLMKDKWGLGHSKKRSDGVLILLLRKSNGHAGIHAQAGYGLEGVLPDGKIGALIDQYAGPSMKRGAYGEAAVSLADAIAAVLDADAAAGGDAAPGKERGGKGIGTGKTQPSSGGLLVTLFAMGAMLIALIVSASRRHFPGKPHMGGAAAATGVSLVALFTAGSGAGWIVFIVALILLAVIWASIGQHRCPKCASWMTIDEEIVEEPTYWSEGVKHITQQCTKCSYHREYDRAIPRKQVVVSSGGGGGGGGFGGGGGGGDGFSGGGGGESGGGGASRDY